MSAVGVIARREYRSRVLTASFVLGTLGAPAIILAALTVPAWVRGGQPGLPTLAVIDSVGALGTVERLADWEASVGLRFADLSSGIDPKILEEMVGEGVVACGVILGRGGAELLLPPGIEGSAARALEAAVARVLQEGSVRLRGRVHGLDDAMLDELLSPPLVRVRRVHGRDPTQVVVVSVAVGTILYATLLTWGLATMRAVVEEKASRVVELLLTSASPLEILAGKILGIAAVGVTQYAVWATLAALARSGGGPGLGLVSGGLSLDVVASSAAFFVLGYALFAALYATVGAMVSSSSDAHHLHLPVTALLVAPIFLLWVVVSSPTAPPSRVLSWVPPFAPVLMVARVASKAASLCEVGASGALVAVTAWACLIGASRVYRASILRRGTPLTFSEVMRCMRR